MMRYLINTMDWTYRFLQVLILIGLVSWPAVGEKVRFRTFTNKEGKKIEASVVDVQGKDLESAMKSGKMPPGMRDRSAHKGGAGGMP